MNRTSGGTAARERSQHGIVESATCVQDYLASASTAGKLGQLARHVCQRIVWRS
jgi:hypothetical protein